MAGFRWLQCRRVRPVLWDYASERLSEGPMEFVEEHLAGCGSCKREVDSLRQTQGFLAACRAEEETVPRSDWHTLRLRLMNETQLPASAPTTPLSLQTRTNVSLRSDSAAFGTALDPADVGWTRRTPRPVWPMYLLTSMAGGFAAVAILAVSYGLLTLHKTEADSSTPSTPLRASSGSKTPGSDSLIARQGNLEASNTDNQVKNEMDQKRVTGLATILLASIQTLPAMVVTSSPTNPGERSIVTDHALAVRHTDRLQHRLVRSFTTHTNGRSKFRRSLPGTDQRPQENRQVADSRYALERVRPVSNEGDEADIYVVGTVQPASRDEDHNY